MIMLPTAHALFSRKWKPLLILNLAFLPAFVLGQTSMEATQESLLVKGQVFRLDDKKVLVGATVLIEGTQTGTVTNPDGEFKLQLPAQETAVLLISYVDLAPYKVIIPSSGTLTVHLSAELSNCTHTFSAALVSKDEHEAASPAPGKSMELEAHQERNILIVIDGVEMQMSSVKELDLDPSRIESVEVLKGEEALKPYAREGLEGVIIIKTKQ